MSLISIKGAQERLGGISRTTVERLIKSGELRMIRIGKRTFIKNEELLEFIEKRSTTDKQDRQLVDA
jgi:excisionase family DNA binding protein